MPVAEHQMPSEVDMREAVARAILSDVFGEAVGIFFEEPEDATEAQRRHLAVKAGMARRQADLALAALRNIGALP